MDNKPIHKWTVTELKDELRRRKLPTKDLVEELVKRLDEALRKEREEAGSSDDGVESTGQVAVKNPVALEATSELTLSVSETTPVVAKTNLFASGTNTLAPGTTPDAIGASAVDIIEDEIAGKKSEKIGDDGNQAEVGPVAKLAQRKIEEVYFQCETGATMVEEKPVVQVTTMETGVSVNQTLVSTIAAGKEDPYNPHDSVGRKETKDANIQLNEEGNEPMFANETQMPRLMNGKGDSSGADNQVSQVTILGFEPNITKRKRAREDSAVKKEIFPDNKHISGKRKHLDVDKDGAANHEPAKRQRRLNRKNTKVPETQVVKSTTVASLKEENKSVVLKHKFSFSGSSASDDGPKERLVPQSRKDPTNSLRIDRFLRPFTLRAVQELLGKTGMVNRFWVDESRTHCYVTYSSVEEAIETRNAVYNLQWPPNGGRKLVAEFVDPDEVKSKLQAPPTPITPMAPLSRPTFRPQRRPREQLHQTLPATSSQPPPPPPPSRSTFQPQRLPREQLHQTLPATSSQPPPPPPSRSTFQPQRLPREQLRKTLPATSSLPLPPLPEKQVARILTPDDLFKKTTTTPWIYYMPLSEEQVAAKLAARNAKEV